MVKDFFPSGEICASVQLHIDPENSNHRAGAASMLDEIFSLVHKWQVRLAQNISVTVHHRKEVHRPGPKPVPEVKELKSRSDSHEPTITLDLCEKYDWDMDKVCATLKIARPALYSRLQRYERDGYVRREKGPHTDWRNAERRDR